MGQVGWVGSRHKDGVKGPAQIGKGRGRLEGNGGKRRSERNGSGQMGRV